MHMRYIIMGFMSGSSIFFHITSQTAKFSKKKKVIEHECFDFVCSFCLKNFSFLEETSKM